MYQQCTTRVTTTAGETEEIGIHAGLHQGTALSPLLFIIIMDVIGEDLDKKAPWTMIFADDLSLSGEKGEDLEGELEEWRKRLEEAGVKVSRAKTEHLPLPGAQGSIRMKQYGLEERTELPKCSSFKYLGTTLQQEGGCSKEVEVRISKAWAKWRELMGVLCDKKISTKLKVLIYKTVIRPVLLYGCETWPVTETLVKKISACEMRMLRYCLGVSWEEHRRNVDIRKEARVVGIADMMRRKRLAWYGHVCRREEDSDVRRTSEMTIAARRKRGKPKHRWLDTIRKDMNFIKECGLCKEDALNREKWRSVVTYWQTLATREGQGGER